MLPLVLLFRFHKKIIKDSNVHDGIYLYIGV